MLLLCAFAATPIGKRMYDWLNSHLKQGLLAVADCGGMLCVLAAAAGRFNLAQFAYAVALLEPKSENAAQAEIYNNLRSRLYAWALDTEGRRQLLTALELLIYSLPNAPKEDF